MSEFQVLEEEPLSLSDLKKSLKSLQGEAENKYLFRSVSFI